MYRDSNNLHIDFPKLTDLRNCQSWSGLHGSALALATTIAASKWHQPLIVIAPNSREADELENSLTFFASSDPQLELYSFPSWECLPYDQFSPHEDITSQRMKLLSKIPSLKKAIIVISVDNLMQRLPPLDYIESTSFELKVGQILDLADFRNRLVRTSYQMVDQVERPGEFVVRGGIIDVFPMGAEAPIRIDLFDDEIDGLRIFDADTQLTKSKIDKFQILPGSEIPLTELGIRSFRQQTRRIFNSDPRFNFVYRNIDEKKVPSGAEFYLPLFYRHTSNFFDYVPQTSIFVVLKSVQVAAEKYWQQINERFEASIDSIERPPLQPAKLYLEPDELKQNLKSFQQIHIKNNGSNQTRSFEFSAVEDNFEGLQSTKSQTELKHHLLQPKQKTVFVLDSYGQRTNLEHMLAKLEIDFERVDSWQTFLDGSHGVGLTVAHLSSGFQLASEKLTVLTGSVLFGSKLPTPTAKRSVKTPERMISSYEELEVGELVVHETYGIGRYQGLANMKISGIETEFLHVEYQGDDSLYVPVYAIDCIGRYFGGNEKNVELDLLSRKKWNKKSSAARAKAFDLATELLELQALRDSHEGNAMSFPQEDYELFVSRFPYRETPDQSVAIQAVLSDLSSQKPMDRLICGDVGFGKTEVALRAALIAVANGFQVALVVPNRILATQHYDEFEDRFSEFAIKVELLSTVQKKSEIKRILNDLQSSQTDIVIGTHRLLQRDVAFGNLGLLIIDEEHRFGVKQKEHLKKLRTSVDILTLTATPIPRTLNMALNEIRDMSIIGTPPDNRLSVRTFVSDWNSRLIREACLRELGRGGQIFYLHNEVRTIRRAAKDLARIVPEAKIGVAHGQLPKLELLAIMKNFYQQKFDTLVCTTIIENGIDIPSANTIIINSASKFGLAQLHQLRGRVGRSHHQAYAYLMVKGLRYLPHATRARLEAIEAFDQLGVGFVLATRDLEIRGAGSLLGREQSGVIDDVGFTLYSKFLRDAVTLIKEKGVDFIENQTSKTELKQQFSSAGFSMNSVLDIDLQISALIPESWIPSVNLRMALYRKISSASNAEELQNIQIEMWDRFGTIPDSVRNLFVIGFLKLRAKNMGLTRLHLGKTTGQLLFIRQPNLDPSGVYKLIEKYPGQVKLSALGSEITLLHKLDAGSDRISTAKLILDCLTMKSSS